MFCIVKTEKEAFEVTCTTPANWIFQISDMLSTNRARGIPDIAISTSHYNVILVITWHWLSFMMNILQENNMNTNLLERIITASS